MTVPREARPAENEARHAEVAALPLATAATLVVARLLPVEFAYRPNDLGIVSVTTVTRYPLQQETFWYVLGVGFGIVAALGIAAALRTRAWAGGRGIVLEAAAAATLGALLVLPARLAAVALVPLAAVVALAWRAPRRGPEAMRVEERADDDREPRPTPRWAKACIAVAALALVLAASPDLPIHLQRLASGTPDVDLTVDDWRFHGESGQHLAWADALREGRVQGRDYFSLYGPYFDLGLVGLWALVGARSRRGTCTTRRSSRSGGSARSRCAWSRAGGAGSRSCSRRSRAWCSCATRSGSSRSRRSCRGCAREDAAVRARRAPAHAGAASRASRAASRCSTARSSASRSSRARRSRCWCAASGAGSRGSRAGSRCRFAPIVAWFAEEGALGPLVRDMAGYPAWLAAGYGKLPFPPLLAALPLDVAPPLERGDLFVRTAYVAPALCAGAFALCAMAAPLEPRRPWRLPLGLREAWRARPDVLVVALVALYGLVAYRSALGRSDEPHVVFVLGAPAILLVLALDRKPAAAARGARPRRVAARVRRRSGLVRRLSAGRGRPGGAARGRLERVERRDGPRRARARQRGAERRRRLAARAHRARRRRHVRAGGRRVPLPRAAARPDALRAEPPDGDRRAPRGGARGPRALAAALRRVRSRRAARRRRAGPRRARARALRLARGRVRARRDRARRAHPPEEGRAPEPTARGPCGSARGATRSRAGATGRMRA